LVGIVVVAHSSALAESVIAIAKQMLREEVPLAAAGGIDDPGHPFGTDPLRIVNAIQSVYSQNGVLILMDMGSSLLSAEMALDFLPEEKRNNVRLCEAPLVEGTIAAAVQSEAGGTVDQVVKEALSALAAKGEQLRKRPDEGVPETSAEIEADEGCVLEVYLDHLGYPTVGVGHLITENDEEYGKPVGTKVSLERVRVLLRDDLLRTASDCGKLYNDFSTLPEEAQLIIANMMFNMGLPRLSKFKKMKEAVDARRWNEAAAQMKDSKWYSQVTNRAERLCQRMKALAD